MAKSLSVHPPSPVSSSCIHLLSPAFPSLLQIVIFLRFGHCHSDVPLPFSDRSSRRFGVFLSDCQRQCIRWYVSLIISAITTLIGKLISHDQLVLEVKNMSAGLVMAEPQCVAFDERQTASKQEQNFSKKSELKNDYIMAVLYCATQTITLRAPRFLRASQPPSANQALSRLATKYSMPATMWRHRIHAFLEVLRHRLPNSREHVLAFIFIA